MLYFNYDSYFRFVAFSRVLYLNKYVVFNFVSLLKITFRLNIVLVAFVLNIVRVNLSCVILFLSFYFIFLLIGLDQGSCKLTQFRPISTGLLLITQGPTMAAMPNGLPVWPFSCKQRNNPTLDVLACFSHA